MIVANFADLHARGKDLTAFRHQWRTALEIAADRGATLATIAGDIFDRSNIADRHASAGAIAGAVIAPIDQFIRGGGHVVMLPGNHDWAGPGVEDALRVFDGMAGVTVLRESGERLPAFDGGEGVSVFALPWRWNSAEHADAALDRLAAFAAEETHAKRILLAHVQVAGARMSGHMTCDTAAAGSGHWRLSRAALERAATVFDRICLGDFHGRQDLTNRGGYVGALRQLSFGEEYNQQGFELWNSDTGAVEWIEVAEARRHVTIVVRSGERMPTAEELMGLGDVHVRVQADGFEPDRADALRLEAAGARVEACIDAPERMNRVANVPEGLLDRPADVLRFWNANQKEPISDAALSALIDELGVLLSPSQAPTGQDAEPTAAGVPPLPAVTPAAVTEIANEEVAATCAPF